MQESPKSDPIWIFASRDGSVECRRRLFNIAAQSYARHMGRPPINLAMEHKPGQKPFFTEERDVHFSISHSGEYWLCAFSANPVGLDIQQKAPIESIQAIARRFFHWEEYNAVREKGEEIFFQIWTAKESYIKYTGQGLSEDFCRFSCITQGCIDGKIRGISIRHIPFAPDYSLCVCARELDQLKMEFLLP